MKEEYILYLNYRDYSFINSYTLILPVLDLCKKTAHKNIFKTLFCKQKKPPDEK